MTLTTTKTKVTFDYGIALIKDTPNNKRVLQDIKKIERSIHSLDDDMKDLWKKIEFDDEGR